MKLKNTQIAVRKTKRILFGISAFLLFTFIFSYIVPQIVYATAGVPAYINFQGRLMDSSGNLLGGSSGTNYCYKFSLYDASTGGSKIWPSGSPSTDTILTREGVFDAKIGNVDTLDLAFTDDQVYVDIQVATKVGATCAPGDGAESFETLSPRPQVVSSGFAINSKTVGGFTPAQSATNNQIPVLTSGELILSHATAAGIRATGSNVFTLQNGVTGDLQFYSSSNKLTSSGALTIAGGFTSNSGTITLGGLGGGGTQCVQVSNTGVLSGTGSSCGTASVAWNSLTNPTGTQTLTFDDGELNSWTVNSDTETFHTITANSLTTGKILSASSSSLTSGTLIDLVITGTGALNNQKGLNISLSGANGTGSQSTYGAYVSNSHTGTTPTNYGIYTSASAGSGTNYGIYASASGSSAVTYYGGYFSSTASSGTNTGIYATASGGDTNYAGIFAAGNVGIGDTSPASLLTVGSGELFQVSATGGATTIAGVADGTDALTLTTGDILVSNGDLDLSGGDFNVVLDAGDGVNISKGAAPTVDVFTIAGGSAATNGVDALALTLTATNQTDFTNSLINGSLTAQGTGAGDIAYGLYLDLAAQAGGTETAIKIQNTAAWNTDIDLQNEETIDNATDGTVNITATNLKLTGSTFVGSSSLTINSAAATSLTLDSGTTGTVNLATGNNVKTLNIANGTAGNAIYIATDNTNADTINIGSALDSITITGSSSSAFVLNAVNVSATEFNVLDAGIELGDLTTQGTATDEYCLTSETGGGALLAWQDCASGVSFTLAGTSGSNQTITNGDTITIAAGTGITTTGGATDTVTVAATLGTDITNGEIVADTIDWTAISDATTLDASTSIGFGASTFALTFTNNGSGDEIHDLTSTGDLLIKDSGTAIATFSDAGKITFAPTSTQNFQVDFTSTGFLDINAASYTNNTGALDLVRTGNFTGVATETANDINVKPSLTLTEPGSGTFTWNGANIDLSSIAVTAGAGTTAFTSLRLAGVSDADAGTVKGLDVANLTNTAATETAISVGTGWDTGLSIGGINIFNGSGGLTTSSSVVSGWYTGITGTGALDVGSITLGFGSIDVGTDSITGGLGTFSDLTVALSSTADADITKSAAAAATEEGLVLTFTAGAGDGSDVYSVIKLATTSANHSASSDKVYGLNIDNLASADAEGEETALFVGTGWDNIFKSANTSLTAAGALTVTSCTGCGGSSTWNAITNPTGTQTLTFDDGELNSWTVSSDTETFHTITANSLTTGKILAVSSSSLTSGALIDVSVSGTAAANNQKGLNISLTGANATGAVSTYGAYISNTHTGTLPQNYGLFASVGTGAGSNYAVAGHSAGTSAVDYYGGYFDATASAGINTGIYATASGGDTNYAGIFAAGNVGIGDSSPTALLTVGSGDLFQVSSTGSVNSTTGQSSTALTIARAGTNYAFQVDTNTASSATGLKITAAAAGGGLALTTISSGTDENLTLDAKGAGTVSIGASSTGNVLLGGGSGSTGCTVTNSTGAFACSAGITAITGDVAITAGTLTLNGTTRISNAGVGTFITGTVIGSQTFTTNSIADSGALTITSATLNALTLDSGTTGTVNLGTGNNAKTINIGTGTAGNTINIGTNNSNADNISIGSALDTLTITGGSSSAFVLNGTNVSASEFNILDGGILWNELSNPSASQSLTFSDGILNSWVVSSDTETFHTIAANSLTTGKILSASSSSLTSGTLIDLAITGTGALTNQKGLNIALSGANASSSQTTYGAYLSNTHTGSGTNVGLYATASGGTNNYAGIFDSGYVGIGTTTPTQKLALADGVLYSHFGTNSTPTALGGTTPNVNANSIFVVGKYAYLGLSSDGGSGNEFQILDVHNPSSIPTAVGGASYNFNFNTIYVANNYVYAGTSVDAGGNELRIYDVTNPSSPSLTGSVDVGSDITSMFVVGRYLYLTKSNNSGTCSGTTLTGCEFSIYDISNPASPAAIGGEDFVDAATHYRGNSVYVQGNYAYVGRDTSTGTCSGTTVTGCEFIVYDISNPFDPVPKNGLNIAKEVNSVYVSGKFAYIGTDSGTGNEFSIYNIGDPTAISSEIGGLEIGADVNTVTNYGKYVYIGTATVSGNDLRIIDASDTTAPSTVGGVDESIGVNEVFASGKYLYVALDTVSGNELRIYDISGIDAPAATIGTLAAGSLNIYDSSQIGNDLNIGNALNVGVGGINSSGSIVINNDMIGDGSTTAIAGIFGNYTFSPSAGGVQIGNRFVSNISNTSTANTVVNTIIRSIDNTTLANLVRGIEVVSNAGSNTSGTNTGIRTTGGTFGLQAFTNATAGSVSLPAAIYGENTGTTQGDVLRLYSTSVTSAPSFATFYHNTSTFTGTGLLMDFAEGSGTFSGNFADFQNNNVTKFKVTSDGYTSVNLRASTNNYAVCHETNGAGVDELKDCSGAPSADYAEMYPVEAGVEFGDIVAVGNELVNTYDTEGGAIAWTKVKGKITRMIKTSRPYQANVIGIVVDNFGDFSSTGYNIKEEDNPKPITLKGRVPVKISASSSDIKAGDYITTSNEVGKGMKAIKAGIVIGKALEDWTASSGKATVMIYVEQAYFNGIRIADYAGLELSPENQDSWSKLILAKISVKSENPIEQSTPVYVAEILTDRVVAGLEVITPKLTANVVDTSTLIVSSDTQLKGLVFVDGEATFAKSVKFDAPVAFSVPPLFSNDTAGFALIKEGARKVRINFDTPYATTPIVTTDITYEATDNIDTSVADTLFSYGLQSLVTDKDNTGFTIIINKNAPQNLRFSWIAIGVKDPKIFESLIEGLTIDNLNNNSVNNSSNDSTSNSASSNGTENIDSDISETGDSNNAVDSNSDITTDSSNLPPDTTGLETPSDSI